MMLVSSRVRVLVAVCSFLLLIPILGIPFQRDFALEQFHNRKLGTWPQSRELLADPVQFFGKVRGWLADRVFPIAGTTVFYKKFLYFVLDTPPQHRVTLGEDGFIFLNGDREDNINGLFDSVCLQAHSEIEASNLKHSLATIANFAQDRGIPVDVVVVPTPATLYAEHLPLSVPPKYLQACRQTAQGTSQLGRLQAPPNMTYIYPFSEMRAARADEAFFPKGNWHAEGMSLKVVRDAYLSSLSVQTAVDDRLERGAAPSEILKTYGIIKDLPIYFLRNEHVTADRKRLFELLDGISDLFPNPSFGATYYRNSKPLLPSTVFMVSDSYGEFASEVFAGAFANVFQVTMSSLPPEHFRELVDRVMSFEHVDRLMLLVEEGDVVLIDPLTLSLTH